MYYCDMVPTSDDASSGLLVESLRVSLLTHLQRSVHKHLEEWETAGSMELSRPLPVLQTHTQREREKDSERIYTQMYINEETISDSCALHSQKPLQIGKTNISQVTYVDITSVHGGNIAKFAKVFG